MGTGFFCQLFGHEWVPRMGRGLECTRCRVFADEDGRLWASRRSYEEDWERRLPTMREGLVHSRIADHCYPLSPGQLLEAVQEYLSEKGFELESPLADDDAWTLKTRRRAAQEGCESYVCRVTACLEPVGAMLRIQKLQQSPGPLCTRFDSIRAVDAELTLARRLDARAVAQFQLEAERTYLSAKDESVVDKASRIVLGK